MSVTESKVKTPIKTSKKAAQAAVAKAVKAALDAAPIEYVPLSSLAGSVLNVRVIPYPDASVRSMANSIKSVGLLQNLVVYTMPDGRSGVAGGGRRLAGLNLLVTENEIPSDYLVPVKRVSEDVARLVSFIENNEHLTMHPAEQIYAFRDLSAQGMTPEQIGAQLGYGGRHVQRMLRLAGLAPELLAKLAKDEMTIEQCQALALENDPARQLHIYETVITEYGHTAASLLKRTITAREVSIKSPEFKFIGRERYEAAGGIVREDLFSAEEGDGTADQALIEKLINEKLTAMAEAIQHSEGWAWSLVRSSPVRSWGVDCRIFQLVPAPEAHYTTGEQQSLDELYATQEVALTDQDKNVLQEQIDEIENSAVQREWTSEQKAWGGVVVSFWCNELHVQRGVRQISSEPDETGSDEARRTLVISKKIEKPIDSISAPLLKKMSSERTLAVQAALVQQPEKAVAMMVWNLCTCVFDYGNSTRHPFNMRLEVHHVGLTSDAPSGKTGTAWQSLMQEKSRLEALLPQGWKKDYTTFFTLDGQTLMSLIAFCTACSVDGVQTRTMGHTSDSNLDGVETAIGFHLRDWWQPTEAGFLGLLSKSQIVEALLEAGLTGAASDAGKMKKRDAASHAEAFLARTRWVPVWMQSPDALKPDNSEADEDEAAGTDNPAESAA